MIRKITLCFLLFLFSLHFSFAQNGSMKGVIKTSDGMPAEFVNVGLKDTNKGTVTDKDGKYSLLHILPGNYILVISSVGLETKQVEVEILTNQTVTVPDIVLKESSQKLEEVIVTGTRSYKENNVSQTLRLNTSLLAIPQNIQLVTAKALSDQQVISMSDGVIRNVSGAARIEHWGDLYTNISMRGTQVQAFRNGFNVVSSFWGPLTEDMSFVDHIEFVKGPAGFMLANGDPSGLYNVVTKKPSGYTRGEVSLTAGSFDFYRASTDLEGKLSGNGKLLYRINLAGQNKNSHRAYEYNNRYSFAPVISYQIDDRTKVTFEYTLQHAKMSDVGSFYIFSPSGYATLPQNFTTMPRGLDPTKINDHSIFVNLQHDINDRWKITAQTAWFYYKQQGSSMWPSAVNADGSILRAVSIWDAQSTMSLAQVFINGRVNTGGISHNILGGIDLGTKDYMADWSQNHKLDTVGSEFNPLAPYYSVPVNGYPAFNRSASLENRTVSSGGAMDQKYSGVYIQDEIGFFEDKVRLTLAGRYTYVNQSSWGGNPITANHITPRAGLSVAVNKQTSVYALYDQAFIPQSGKLANGGDVKPITGNNTEVGIKRDWAGGKWNTTLSAYRILKNNELTADPNSAPNSGLSVVLGQKTAQGFEFDLKGTVVTGLNLTANYAFTESKVTKVTEGVTSVKEGDLVPGYAKHTANGWLNYRIPSVIVNGLSISAGFTYMADRATYSWSTTNSSRNLPDYFKLDGGVAWENNKLKISLNIFNLLNEYLYSGGYYEWLSAYYWQTEAPRNFRLGVTYRF